MEAESYLRRLCVTLAAGLITSVACLSADAANFRTQNFLIQAPDAGLARAVGEAAEKYRHDLAMYWLGSPLQAWPNPCPVRVVAGANLAAQGVTTYNRAPVRDFQMEVVGTPERILDSVLPHEVTHTVLATHFGRPLPRWADEGICTTVEHESERNKHEAKLREFLRTRRGIAMNRLFLLTEYPNDVLPMYAQGYSVCQFLIGQKDPQTFIAFLQDYMRHPSWTANIKKHYDYDSLAELQDYWLSWVAAGSGPVERFAKVRANTPRPGALVANEPSGNERRSNAVVPASASTPLALDVPENTLPKRSRTIDSPPAPGTALASVTDQGWYQRKRLEAQAGDPGLKAATPAGQMVPPSVRNSGRYKSAQPQPEMQISRGGDARGPWTNDAAGSPRFR